MRDEIPGQTEVERLSWRCVDRPEQMHKRKRSRQVPQVNPRSNAPAGSNVIAFPVPVAPASTPTTEFDRQLLRVAEVLEARRLRQGLPPMGTRAVCAVVRRVWEEIHA